MGDSGQNASKTIAFIGCGNMGSAILSGLLNASQSESENAPISHFIACTHSAESAKRLQSTFSQHKSRLEVQHSANLAAMKAADIIVLGCKPYMAEAVLTTPGVREALQGKLLISILAGTAPSTLERYLYGDSGAPEDPSLRVYIARAMPNMAAYVSESMTILEEASPPLPSAMADILSWIFTQIGAVKTVPSSLFDVSGILAGSAMAVLSLALDGLLDGCVVEGLKRADALEMAAQMTLGMAKLLRNGEHPAVLREKISSPRGCTIQALMTAERAGLRSTCAQTVIDGTERLRQMNGAQEK